MASKLRSLSSADLVRRLQELEALERSQTLEFVFLLAEMGRRQHHLELGFSSLFAYCFEGLGLEKSFAYRRSTAAQLLLRFPACAAYLRDGRLSVTTLVALRRVLKHETHLRLLDAATGLSENQVKRLVAAEEPRVRPRDVVRRLPSRSVDVSDLVSVLKPIEPVAASPANAPAPTSLPAPATAVLPPPQPRMTLLDAEFTRVAFSADAEFMDLLARTRAALSHVVPDGNLQEVLREALRLTLEAVTKRRASAASAAPATSAAADDSVSVLKPNDEKPASRYIPAEVRAQVWARDGGRCAFVGVDGWVCRSDWQVEFSHLVSFARGGANTADNLRLTCRRHNLHEAVVENGAEYMRRFVVVPEGDGGSLF